MTHCAKYIHTTLFHIDKLQNSLLPGDPNGPASIPLTLHNLENVPLVDDKGPTYVFA